MWRAVFWEIKMDISSTLRYRFGIITDILIYSGLLIFFLMSNSGKTYQDTYHYENYKELLVIGYLAWIYAVTAITSISQIVSGELRQGTFYKKYNSIYPLQVLLLGRMTAALLIQSIVVVIVVLAAIVFGNITISIQPFVILPIVISTIGMYGIGLIVAGMSIFHKRTGSILYIIQLCLLFITDTIPTAEGITSITLILPLTLCNTVIRKAIAGISFMGDFIKLFVSALFFLILGIVIFHLYLKKAREKGNLLFY